MLSGRLSGWLAVQPVLILPPSLPAKNPDHQCHTEDITAQDKLQVITSNDNPSIALDTKLPPPKTRSAKRAHRQCQQPAVVFDKHGTQGWDMQHFQGGEDTVQTAQQPGKCVGCLGLLCFVFVFSSRSSGPPDVFVSELE
ncbi:unnamed protein product [Boreogadus saida]